MDLGISDKVKPILDEVTHFIDTEILPLEQEFHDEVSVRATAGLILIARLRF